MLGNSSGEGDEPPALADVNLTASVPGADGDPFVLTEGGLDDYKPRGGQTRPLMLVEGLRKDHVGKDAACFTICTIIDSLEWSTSISPSATDVMAVYLEDEITPCFYDDIARGVEL